jgi:ATP-binding protein involved in chromosome partitioning
MAESHDKSHAGHEDDRKKREERELAERMSTVGQKLLVLSGKGGVGKSTVAANLALALARAGKRVGLLDVDIHGPSIPTLLGLAEERVTGDEDGILPLRVQENLAVMSIGFLVPSRGDAVIWRGPLKYSAIRQFLKDVKWGALDYLIVDSPPGTGDEPLSVVQLVGEGARAVIVTTPQELAIADVRRCVSFCRTLGLGILGIVENMSGFVCPHCGAQLDIFKTGGGSSLAGETGVPLLGRIPIEPEIVAAGDEGNLSAWEHADSPAAQAFAAIVERIVAERVTAATPATKK